MFKQNMTGHEGLLDLDGRDMSSTDPACVCVEGVGVQGSGPPSPPTKLKKRCQSLVQ